MIITCCGIIWLPFHVRWSYSGQKNGPEGSKYFFPDERDKFFSAALCYGRSSLTTVRVYLILEKPFLALIMKWCLWFYRVNHYSFKRVLLGILRSTKIPLIFFKMHFYKRGVSILDECTSIDVQVYLTGRHHQCLFAHEFTSEVSSDINSIS